MLVVRTMTKEAEVVVVLVGELARKIARWLVKEMYIEHLHVRVVLANLFVSVLVKELVLPQPRAQVDNV